MLTLMYNTLYKHPAIGLISGIISTICYKVHAWLTDEALLKLVSSVGVWAGTLVAVLSAIVYLFKVARLFHGVYKRWKTPPVVCFVACLMALLLAGCGARNVAMKKTTEKSRSDSSYDNSTSNLHLHTLDSVGSTWIKSGEAFWSGSSTIDTGKIESSTKTTISAQFAPGTGPTAQEVTAAAGDQAKAAQLLSRATSLNITTDRKLSEQKALFVKFEELLEATTEQAAQARLLAMGRDSTTITSKGQVKKEAEKLTKEKDSQREAWPGSSWVLIIGGALLAVLFIYYFFFRKK